MFYKNYVAVYRWHVTGDMWHPATLWEAQSSCEGPLASLVEGKNSLKISAPQLLQFGIDSVLKILNKRITELLN